MKKSIIIIDLLLIITFVLILIAKATNASFITVIQPIFFVLVIIHIIQHWKILVRLVKRLFQK